MLKNIRKIILSIKNRIEGLSSRNKFFLACIVLAIIIIFSKIIGIFDTTSVIDYDSINSGEEIYTVSFSLDDFDKYIQLKTIADDFLLTCSGSNVSDDGNDITLDQLYKYCLYPEYKSQISRNAFIKLSNDFYSKINNINISEIVPTNIVEYKDDFYLIRYSINNINDESSQSIINLYLGIFLDTINSKYYIWYIE